MTTEELFDLVHRQGWHVDEQHRFVLTREQLGGLAATIRSRAFQELHEYAVGPEEHEAIERLQAKPVDSLAKQPFAARIPDQDLMARIGMAEWSSRTLQLARRVEYLVWIANRLRVPEDK